MNGSATADRFIVADDGVEQARIAPVWPHLRLASRSSATAEAAGIDIGIPDLDTNRFVSTWPMHIGIGSAGDVVVGRAKGPAGISLLIDVYDTSLRALDTSDWWEQALNLPAGSIRGDLSTIGYEIDVGTLEASETLFSGTDKKESVADQTLRSTLESLFWPCKIEVGEHTDPEEGWSKNIWTVRCQSSDSDISDAEDAFYQLVNERPVLKAALAQVILVFEGCDV